MVYKTPLPWHWTNSDFPNMVFVFKKQEKKD